ncbi:hypothetical protein PIROE2DRAFT_4323, partial [Piromyces sp. E2]
IKIKKKTETVKENDIIEKLRIVYENIESKDWKVRNSSIDELTEIVVCNPKLFKNQKLLFPLFDKIAERGKDTNTKISIHITKSLIKIIEVLKANVDPVLVNFVSIYLNNLSSTNKLLQVETLKLINILIDPKYEVDQTKILKIFSYGILHIPNTKIKELLLEKMIVISSNLFQSKPSVLYKQLIPTIIELLKIKKNGIRHSITRLLRHLSEIYGKQEFENILTSQYIDNYNEICTLIETIFQSPFQAKLFSNYYEDIFADGTFYATPKFSNQLFITRTYVSKINMFYITSISILKNKQDTYEVLFNEIKKKAFNLIENF